MRILAIDPGNTQSAYVLIDRQCRPVEFGKIDNYKLLDFTVAQHNSIDFTVIEMVASYGMPVGREVFETVLWTGRFLQTLDDRFGIEAELIERQPVKLHHCHSSRANDANISQALRDRFGGKGTKAEPGWFYGFAGDVWQAYALAVYKRDTVELATNPAASLPYTPLRSPDVFNDRARGEDWTESYDGESWSPIF